MYLISFSRGSYLYVNELMGYVVFRDFDEIWPEYSSDINWQREWGLCKNKNIFPFTSQRATTTEMSSIVQLKKKHHISRWISRLISPSFKEHKDWNLGFTCYANEFKLGCFHEKPK